MRKITSKGNRASGPTPGAIAASGASKADRESVMYEQLRRRWAACEALAIGRGGISTVARATGMSPTTIRKGIDEIKQQMPQLLNLSSDAPSRRVGGGRPSLREKDPTLVEDLQDCLATSARNESLQPLSWSAKSTRALAEELRQRGHVVSHMTVARLLREMGYRLQAHGKASESRHRFDAEGQWRYINNMVRRFLQRRQPVIALATESRHRASEEIESDWQPGGGADDVAYEPSMADGPQGDLIRCEGESSPVAEQSVLRVGQSMASSILPAMALDTIGRWWQWMGWDLYPHTQELLIVEDAVGRHGGRSRQWKHGLQKLANACGIAIHVCHLPAGTSKWNEIQYRMFHGIAEQWRGHPLTEHIVSVSLIGHTRRDGMQYRQEERSATDEPRSAQHWDPPSAAAADDGIELTKDPFQGDWNYQVSPYLKGQ